MLTLCDIFFATPGSPFRWIWTSKTHIKLYNFKSDHWFALSFTSSFCKLSSNTINFLAWKIRCEHFMFVLTFWKSGSNVPLAMFSIRTSHQEGLLEKYAVKSFTQTFTSTLQKQLLWWCYSSDNVITHQIYCSRSDLATSQGKFSKYSILRQISFPKIIIFVRQTCLLWDVCKVPKNVKNLFFF